MNEKTFCEDKIPLIKVKGGLPFPEAIQNHPDLIPYLKSRDPPRLNLKNRTGLLLYNKYIAKDKFGLDVILEEEKAVIPTPILRYNFLLQFLKPKSTIIELGTGPSALIAMIAAKHFGAKVFATEMDPLYLKLAKENVLRNNLENRISIVDSKGNFLDNVFPSDLKVDYIISNPPYYDKIRFTKLLWGGKEHELVSGSLGQHFIIQMIKEGWKYLKSDGKIAFMIPKKRIETLIAVNEFINTIECERSIIGLKAGNRIRYVFILNKN